MRFVDTNILLYSISSDPAEVAKMEIAVELLSHADLGLSVQVLQEFLVQSTQAGKPGALSNDDALALIDTWLRYPVQETTVELARAAAVSAKRWQLSYWDAAVVEAARMLGCNQLLTEDLNHHEEFGGVLAVNPFLRA